MTIMYPKKPEPTAAAPITAELLQIRTLDPDGRLFEDVIPDTWDAADSAAPEYISLGQVAFHVVHQDARELALTLCAEPEVDSVCWKIRFEPPKTIATPSPSIGQFLVLQTEEAPLVFLIWITHDDASELNASDPGLDAVRNPGLDQIKENEALLIQIVAHPQTT